MSKNSKQLQVDFSTLKLSLIKNRQLSFRGFTDFNIYLVNYNIKIGIKEYIECIQPYLFKNLDLSILNTFLNYCKDDTLFIISEDDLIQYKLMKDSTIDSIEKFINENKLICDQDYRMRKLNKKNNFDNLNNVQGIILITKEYRFTSRSLKKTLMCKFEIYKDYFLLLENCIFNYSEYQNNLYHKLVFMQDIKLDNLVKQYQEQSNTISTLLTSFNSMINTNKLIFDNLNFVNDKMNDINYSLEKNKLDNNNNLMDNNKLTKFSKIMYTLSIFKVDENKLFYINTYTELKNIATKKNGLRYNVFDLLYVVEYNSKHIDIIYKIKDKFNDKITLFNSEIILNTVTSIDIINYIQEEIKQFI